MKRSIIMMYVRQARPLGCRGWEAARRKVEKDEKDGGLPGTKGVGRRGSMPRRGGEGPRVHFAYNLLALDIPEVMLYRSCHRPSSSRSSLPLLPAIALTPYYDRVDLSPFLALVFPSFTRSMLIPVVSFSFSLPMTWCASSGRLAAITLGRSLRNI